MHSMTVYKNGREHTTKIEYDSAGQGTARELLDSLRASVSPDIWDGRRESRSFSFGRREWSVTLTMPA